MENGIKYKIVLSKVDHVRQTSSFFDKIRDFFKKCSAVDLIRLDLSKTFEAVLMEIIILAGEDRNWN